VRLPDLSRPTHTKQTVCATKSTIFHHTSQQQKNYFSAAKRSLAATAASDWG
jgi:hypothetical protein